MKYVQLSVPSPGHVPSFSSSSCPSIQNSLRPSPRCHTTDRPAPPTPPAGCEMSLRPNGMTGSSGCTHSSLHSGGREKYRDRNKGGTDGNQVRRQTNTQIPTVEETHTHAGTHTFIHILCRSAYMIYTTWTRRHTCSLWNVDRRRETNPNVVSSYAATSHRL